MNKYRISLACTLAALAMSGCISIGGGSGGDSKNPPSIYTLHPDANVKPAAAAARGRTPTTIFVERPTLPPGFETERLAVYFEKSQRLDYAADAKWSERLDNLLQDFIIQMTGHSLPGRAAATSDATAPARYKLVVKMTDFQPVYGEAADAAPRLDVGMSVTLIALPGETVRTQFNVKKTAAASENRLTVITKEMDALLQSATEEALQKIAPHL